MDTATYAPAALCVALLVPTLALAQSEASVGDVEEIDTVTIIGSRGEAADVPGSAHVVDTEELEVFIQSDILRVLRTVPGVYVQEEEGFGLRPNIGIRGSGLDRSARIALLEDGVLVAPAPYAAPSAYYFPTQRRMTSLEVLKGPAAVVIGPRTTGGAINMVSTPIPEDTGGKIDVRWGDHNTRDAHLNFGTRGERFSWLMETVQSASDGFKHIDGPVGGDTGYELKDYIAKVQFDSDPAQAVYQSLRFKAGYTDQNSDETYLGLIDNDFAARPNRRYAASAGDNFVSEHEQYQLAYVIDPGNNWRAKVTAYRNEFARNWYKLQAVNGTSIGNVLDDAITNAAEFAYLTGATSPDDAITKRANNRTYFSQGIQAQIEWDFGFGDTEVALTTGVRVHDDEEDRFQHEDAFRMEDGALILTTAGAPGSNTNRVSTADVQSLFVDTEIRTGRWILTPGVRFEDIDMRRLDFATVDPTRSAGPTRVRENSTSVVIPGMGALYRLNDEWRLLAGMHKGFNPPAPGSTANEETSLNIEAGLRFDSGNLNVESIFFRNDYDNLVGTVTESTGGGGEIGDQFDGGEVLVSGLELSTAYSWSFGNIDVPVGLQYTWTNKAEFRNAFDSGFDPWGDVAVGDELPYIPEHQFRVTAGLLAEKWSANVAANYIGDMRSEAGQGATGVLQSVQSHVVWDMVASWKFTGRLSSYVKVDNLLDETYIAARRPAGVRPGLPRTAYLGLIYRL
ncbi:MAG: TonB-dependent receptor [Gammaproteobacteria bacterium]|nr:TonB-dependent receptor [Gammaproteobacteria bacterium]NNC56815.1 TonB-dependent receptor [Woeseiaceae bacterium]NNL51110.1 TonB-dependent receptor [Woeseiaceae bacterium]